MYFHNSDENAIWLNDVIENELAFHFNSSTENFINNNNFIDNTVQGISSVINSWDGYTDGGGNFWSDYTGPDVLSGVDRNQPGCDGYGDTDYNPRNGIVDHYPLLRPIGSEIPYPPQNFEAQGGNRFVHPIKEGFRGVYLINANPYIPSLRREFEGIG